MAMSTLLFSGGHDGFDSDAVCVQITALFSAGCVCVAFFVTCAKKPKPGAKGANGGAPAKGNQNSTRTKEASKSSAGLISTQQDSQLPKSTAESKTPEKKQPSSNAKKEDKEEKKPDKKKNKTKPKEKDEEERVPDNDYGEVAEPTVSQKKRREQQLEREKVEKIQKGFYQSKSDDDDTLDPIKSLKHEDTNTESTKKSFKRKKKSTEQKTT
uniref:Uncharacterized protein n=1 Tax=Panagrellus redivivus TaxID=6233 RepID=A0A7E4VEB4_PANRE